ncbi:Uncharacterised protein [Zhongshania aliphaticivorans]|uniref:Uncharacterized protein n=1 Tax=Zhongshania aliphaticivorans TaxID=1470434 RepID=A0A5S9PN18_9GAMM|nr:hypothetical protein [Zhongshania aliphaticivorans]CAA0105816.1 Uncharacterised protein [Zhongshania aliphaticivorans]CAA0106006.1 Uncharacterised protein [Zhongshania aliphaticivorans]
MKFRLLVLLYCLSIFPIAHAASWQACRAKKIETVRLEQALGNGKKLKGYKSGATMKKARRSKEEWIWKNCRYYASRLRDIERDMM